MSPEQMAAGKRIAAVTAKFRKLGRRIQKVANRVGDAISKARKAPNPKAVRKRSSRQSTLRRT